MDNARAVFYGISAGVSGTPRATHRVLALHVLLDGFFGPFQRLESLPKLRRVHLGLALDEPSGLLCDPVEFDTDSSEVANLIADCAKLVGLRGRRWCAAVAVVMVVGVGMGEGITCGNSPPRQCFARQQI